LNRREERPGDKQLQHLLEHLLEHLVEIHWFGDEIYPYEFAA
jgi:hypothetical protein